MDIILINDACVMRMHKLEIDMIVTDIEYRGYDEQK